MIEIKQIINLECDICGSVLNYESKVPLLSGEIIKPLLPNDWKVIGAKNICLNHEVKIIIDGKEL